MNLKINRLDNLAAAVVPCHQLLPQIISRQGRDERKGTSVRARRGLGVRRGAGGGQEGGRRRLGVRMGGDEEEARSGQEWERGGQEGAERPTV